MASKSDGRTRNFATIVYEESAPENWRSILGELCIPCFISPLHDKDVKDDTGELKKPHWHVMFMFEGKKSKAQIKEITDQIGGVGIEVVNSMRGYARYLCHLDNSDKAKYDTADVVSFGGADYNRTIALVSDKFTAIREIIQWCNETGTESYAVLLEYCAVNNDAWFAALCEGSGTMVIREYLKSKSWTRKQVEFPSNDSKVEGMTDFHAGNFRATMQERKEIEQKGFERIPDNTQCPFEQTVIDDE